MKLGSPIFNSKVESSVVLTMGRSACCDGIGLKKGPWTTEEDQKLFAYIQEHGHGSWRTLPQKAGLQRCGKSCRLRWINYLKPDIKRGKFTLYEEQTIIQLHALLGNRWSIIAAHLPNRTDNEIKNCWNTRLRKRLAKMGIDPVTHKRKHTLCPDDKAATVNMSVIDHIAQWESTRLEAEARLAKESKLLRFRMLNNSLGVQCQGVHHDQLVPSAGARPSFDILKAWQSGYGGNSTMTAPPYTLSFLETAVAMLARKSSSDNLLRTDSKSPSTAAATVDHPGNPEDNFANIEVMNGLLGDECVVPGSDDEWNIGQENSYWNDIFGNNPETLYSVVY